MTLRPRAVIISVMKKSFIARAFLIVLLIVGVFAVFSSCENNTSSSGVYTREGVEDGVTYRYTLTVDESRGTFSIIRQSNPEIVYSGTFTNKNGYLILESKQNGTEYVKIIGNTFSFFTPDDAVKNCEHDYVYSKESAGNCISKGYVLYKCSLCGAEKTEYTTYGNHSYETVSYKKGNCKTKGCTTKKCTLCGETVELFDKEYGEHTLSEETRVDTGCINKIEVRRRCTTCNVYIESVELDEYGSHRYDENGVCTICHYDASGLCHIHTDEDKDGNCDDCAIKIEVAEAIDANGYYLSDDGKTLYFGAYPTLKADYEVSSIISEGKFDPTTGYYRYKNASFAIKEKRGVKYAFLVTPLSWSKFTINGVSYFACNYIADRKVYLNSVDIKRIQKQEDSTIIYEYYNNNYYNESSNFNVKANNWEKSALYEFANNNFLNTAFTSLQKDMITGSIGIPSADFDGATEEENSYALSVCSKAENTNYSIFVSEVSETSLIFTSSSGSAGNTVKCINAYEIRDAYIYNTYGFVPVIRFSVD